MQDGGALFAAADQATGGEGDLGRGQSGLCRDAVARHGQVVKGAEAVLHLLQAFEETPLAARMVEQAGEELGGIAQGATVCASG